MLDFLTRRKQGYTVTINNSTNEIIIRSTIYFNFLTTATNPQASSNLFGGTAVPGTPVAGAPPYTQQQLRMNSFMHYVQNNIQEVWNSELNRGLQSNFNGSPYRVRTYISVRVSSGANQTLNRGEMQINVWPNPGRDNIDKTINRRTGNFFYDDQILNRINAIPTNIRFVAVPAGGGGPIPAVAGVQNTIIGDYSPGPTPRYDYGHEFGHVLGLADRYHSLANIDFYAPPSNRFRIRSHDAPANRPMYLPGYFDPEEPTNVVYDDDRLNPNLPHYNQGPYLPIYKGTATPQNNYIRQPYDIDYSIKFGWLHNLMSTTQSVHLPGQNPFRDINPTYEFIYTNDPALNTFVPNIFPPAVALPFADPPHSLAPPLVGSATSANSQKTLIITQQQISIISNTRYREFDRHRQIFERFVFAKNNSSSSNKEPFDPDVNTQKESTRKFDLNRGSFVGITFEEYNNGYSSYTRSDLEQSKIVSDEVYDAIDTFPTIAVGGGPLIGVTTAALAGVAIPPPVPGVPTLITNNTIVINTGVNHGLNSFDLVSIDGVLGTTNANVNMWPILVTTPQQFVLLGTDFNVAYGGGGTIQYTRAVQKSTPIVFYIVAVTSGAGNTIQITTDRPHPFQTGNVINITEVDYTPPSGATQINGSRTITVIDSLNFTIQGSTFPGGNYVINTIAGRGRINVDIDTPANNGITNAGGLIQITTTVPHGLLTGDKVTIQGAGGVNAANGTFAITVVNALSFTLNNSVFAGAYTGGATITTARVRLGVDDVMDYRMSTFSTLNNKWAPTGNRFATYGFFSIDIFNQRFSRGSFAFNDFTPFTLGNRRNATQFLSQMDLLLKGGVVWRNFCGNPIANRRALTDRGKIANDIYSEIGFFSQVLAKKAWNEPIEGGNVTSLTPSDPPPGWAQIFTPGIFGAPAGALPLVMPGAIAGSNNIIINGNWSQNSSDPNEWVHSSGIQFTYLLYYSRLDFIFLP